MEQQAHNISNNKTYIIFNKKIGQSTVKGEENSIFETLKKEKIYDVEVIEDLYLDASGLVLLTNDITFKDRIEKENSSIKKEYLVELDRQLESIDKKKIEKGIQTQTKKFHSCSIKQLGKSYLIKFSDGENNEVKEIFQELEYNVTALHKTKMSKLNIQKSGLKPGKYKIIIKELIEKKIFP